MSMHLYQEIGFTIIVVYVDYLNLVETLRELTRTTKYLKKELEMKDLGKTKKKISWPADRVFAYWSFGSPINIYEENF